MIHRAPVFDQKNLPAFSLKEAMLDIKSRMTVTKSHFGSTSGFPGKDHHMVVTEMIDSARVNLQSL